MSGRSATSRDAAYEALKSYGPMTTAQIAEATGKNQEFLGAAIRGARKDYGTTYFVVTEWGKRIVYAAGPRVDAPRKPKEKARSAPIKPTGQAHPFSGLPNF